MSRINVYWMFVALMCLWGSIVLISTFHQDIVSRDTNLNCDVVNIINKSMLSLDKHDLHGFVNSEFKLDIKSRTSKATSVIHHYFNTTQKSRMLKRLHRTIHTHKRPNDSSYNFNVTASDRYTIDRELEDTRPEICRLEEYNIDNLPTASVVIPFYNEALSMLLRTVYSVLNRSPASLLQDVILVDDASTYAYISTLEDHVALLPRVRLLRNAERQGLVRSRLHGARESRAEVVIFLDAHTEANAGWLEPILAYLESHPQSVVQPFVDGIEQWTIKFTAPSEIFRGATTWDLRYVWTEMPLFEQERAREGFAYFSPTLIGCAIAVYKDYFYSIGSFDAEQLLWGGENIELSFRTWLCGGHVATLPCSRVGHLFREIPYRTGDNKWIEHLHTNQMRVAEVWMEDYKRFFYASTTVYPQRQFNLTQDQWKSLEERKKLKETLNCKPFRWYLENVVPDIPVPTHNARYHGELTNLRTRACWEVLPDGYIGITYLCFEHRILVNNFFTLTTDGSLVFRDKCVTFEFPGPALRVEKCPKESKRSTFGIWSMRYYGDSQFGHLTVEREVEKGVMHIWCVHQVTSVTAHPTTQMPQVGTCNTSDVFQKWAFTYRFDKLFDIPIL